MLLKTLLESANQRAYAQPRVFATEQVPAFRNFTAPYRTGFREGETAVFFFLILGRNFQIWVCFAVATWSHWCCLTHNMPPSAPTKQRWLRTSVPRVFEDTSTGKWRLRLLYTRARGQKPGRKQSIWFTSRADAENAADSWRRSWEEGRQGVLPTEPLSPSKPEETEALSPELPKGKCHLCEYVSRLQK